LAPTPPAFTPTDSRVAEPPADLGLFKSATFPVANIVGFLTFMTLMGGLFLIPFFLRNILAYSPIRAGLALGFHAIEFDVMLARDDGPILMHDPQLGRTVAGSGNVSDYSARQLAAMDAGSWLDPKFRGEPVPGGRSAEAMARRR